jgi:ketosteroid isomerase-like protein/quercetin dioxygenase-like cupin family protein
MNRLIALVWMIGFAIGCAPSVNVEQERETLMRLDREWSASAGDVEKFLSYYAPDASTYAPGIPRFSGTDAHRQTLTAMFGAPGFSLEFEPTKADVSASGDIGYTAGTYKSAMNGMTDQGKYVAVWKKQPDGQWKVMEDIYNADAGPPPAAHVMARADSLTWADGPPGLPAGAKVAVVAGDPTKAGPFVLRAQVPAGYKVAPHWHPTDESLTILSGTVALGTGDTWDEAGMQELAAGGFVTMPAEMRHSFLAKTAATFQVHGMGPFAINYVNPADDPSMKQ